MGGRKALLTKSELVLVKSGSYLLLFSSYASSKARTLYSLPPTRWAKRPSLLMTASSTTSFNELSCGSDSSASKTNPIKWPGIAKHHHIREAENRGIWPSYSHIILADPPVHCEA